MSGRVLAWLAGVVVLMSCGSPTAAPDELQYPVMRVTVTEVRIADPDSSRRLELTARLDNAGSVEFEVDGLPHLFFRDSTLGWIDVSGPRGSALGSSGLPGFIRVSPGQSFTQRLPFYATPSGATYHWPLGSFSGSYRVGFGARIGNYILSPLLVSSDPFDVVDPLPP
jgi:hypothetical protein